MEDLKNIIEIDHNALDLEWIEQPKNFLLISTELADEKKLLEKLKLRADVTESEVAKNVRDNPDKYGLSKVTEAGIKSAVAGSDEMKKALQRIIDKKHDVDILQSAVTAMDHRKRALENLVTLHGQQYFSSPKEPRDLDAEFLKDSKKRRARTRKDK